jgi:hypothetical protein
LCYDRYVFEKQLALQWNAQTHILKYIQGISPWCGRARNADNFAAITSRYVHQEEIILAALQTF